MTERNDTSLEDAVELVVSALRRGEVVVIPTDTVYGLAADPTSPDAMRRLFALKERPQGVPVAVLIGSFDQARRLVEITPTFQALADAHWPGALTIVANQNPQRDQQLHLGEVTTVGVRLPDHDLIAACAKAFGPIAATSANHHGEPTITDPAELEASFGDEVELIIDGGVLDGIASTVVKVTTDRPEVLRQGVVRLDQCN